MGRKVFTPEQGATREWVAPLYLSMAHAPAVAGILTLPVTLPVVGSNRVKPCRIVVSGASGCSVTARKPYQTAPPAHFPKTDALFR